MFLIGLTGGIGTGKSTVSNYLRKYGIPVLDSDLIAREVVEPGTTCWKRIREEFGEAAIDGETGEINRAYLAEVIFNDPEKRLVLNRITHPEIQRKIVWSILYNFFTLTPFVVLDVPLFFEVGVYRRFCAYTIVVKCSREQQIERIRERNAYSEEEANKRVDAQMPIEEKCLLADFVIDNSGERQATIDGVSALLRTLPFPLSFWLLRLGLIAFYISISFVIPYMVLQ